MSIALVVAVVGLVAALYGYFAPEWLADMLHPDYGCLIHMVIFTLGGFMYWIGTILIVARSSGRYPIWS